MKAILVYKNDKPIFVSKVVDIKDSLEYSRLSKQCSDNLELLESEKTAIINNLSAKIENLDNLLNETITRLENAEKELAYNRGDITEQEYKGGK